MLAVCPRWQSAEINLSFFIFLSLFGAVNVVGLQKVAILRDKSFIFLSLFNFVGLQKVGCLPSVAILRDK